MNHNDHPLKDNDIVFSPLEDSSFLKMLFIHSLHFLCI